jgi:hypothetical protein
MSAQHFPSISDKQRKLEITAVIVTGAGKFYFMDTLGWKFPFIALAIISWIVYVIYQSKKTPGLLTYWGFRQKATWIVYVIYQSKKTPGLLTYWGFRRDNFKQVLKMVLPFGIVAVISCMIIGWYRDTLQITWHIIPILLLYPIWGVIQQYLVISLVAGNLKDMRGVELNNTLIIFIAALLFGWLHYPWYWLIAGTFALALFYGFIYLKARNVFVMGLFHGWLGAIFFYTVVGRDPFAEVFGKFL